MHQKLLEWRDRPRTVNDKELKQLLVMLTSLSVLDKNERLVAAAEEHDFSGLTQEELAEELKDNLKQIRRQKKEVLSDEEEDLVSDEEQETKTRVGEDTQSN